jgi:hypothetical protein
MASIYKCTFIRTCRCLCSITESSPVPSTIDDIHAVCTLGVAVDDLCAAICGYSRIPEHQYYAVHNLLQLFYVISPDGCSYEANFFPSFWGELCVAWEMMFGVHVVLWRYCSTGESIREYPARHHMCKLSNECHILVYPCATQFCVLYGRNFSIPTAVLCLKVVELENTIRKACDINAAVSTLLIERKNGMQIAPIHDIIVEVMGVLLKAYV